MSKNRRDVLSLKMCLTGAFLGLLYGLSTPALARTIVVNNRSPQAGNGNPGTEAKPLLVKDGRDDEAMCVCVAEGTPDQFGESKQSLVKLAAAELRRYIYLRTGKLPVISGKRDGSDFLLKIDPTLQAQQFRIRTAGGAVEISGGSDVGVLYGAYRYAELLGVRFYLHGDVVPDERLKELPVVKEESGKPLFNLRGVNTWGWHPQGMDAWSADDYKAVFTQLAKMRMNFLGVHCYPEGHPMAEPTVWHGLPGDFDAMGHVQRSYVSRYYNTVHAPPAEKYVPTKTSDFHFGGSQLFDDKAWAPDVLRGHTPLPVTPEDCNEVFNRMAAQFKDAFTFARHLGVKTCLGTEAPLIMPKVLSERTKDVRAVYEGTFRRIMASHPLDYYWIWTPEGWTWGGNKPAEYSNTVADIKLAIEAAKKVNAPFRIATAGWVLGPQHDRAAFDNDMPKNIPMSAISRNTGLSEVDPAFARIAGRELWAIPWLESDWNYGLATIQLHAGRMRRDAVDARDYGCTGLMGLHWRTEDLGPNASALAQAAWDQRWSTGATWAIMGKVCSFSNAAIAGTTDAPLYRSCRYDLGTIRLQAPAGRYKVTLKFCEPHFDAAGERICDVRVQGNTVLTNLDIFAKVGKFAALDFSFDDIAVTNGALTIELVARKSLPCISGVAIEGTGFTNKMNLGGAAYNDWQSDAGKPRSLPVDDFYTDWALANFGLTEAGAIFAAIDGGAGKLPKAVQDGCPTGDVTPDKTPWNKIAPQFAFVDGFEKLRPQVKGAGNLDRFDYWLNTFKYHRALAMTRCAMGVQQPGDVFKHWAEAYTCLLATANTPGAFGMVANMEVHSGWGPAVAKAAGQPFPKDYQGTPRMIVPCVRSVVNKGESLKLKIIALAKQPVSSVIVHVRPLGRGDWQTIVATHIAQSVYEAKLPAAQDDFEYYITAGEKLIWPATAPEMNQTVIVME